MRLITFNVTLTSYKQRKSKLKMPRDYISRDGFQITEKARQYFAPLILGEDYPPYKNGMPQYARLKKVLAQKKLKKWRWT